MLAGELRKENGDSVPQVAVWHRFLQTGQMLLEHETKAAVRDIQQKKEVVTRARVKPTIANVV